METHQVLWFAFVWLIGCSAGISRAIRDRNGLNTIDAVSIGFCSGFLAIAVVSLCLPDPYRGGPIGLGVGSLVGLMGKDLNNALVRGLSQRFLPQDDDDNGKK